MTDTSGGSEEEEDEEFISDFEQSFYNENSDHLYLFIETLKIGKTPNVPF